MGRGTGQTIAEQPVSSRSDAGLLFRSRSEDPSKRLLERLREQQLISYDAFREAQKGLDYGGPIGRAFADTVLANAQLMPEGEALWRKVYSRDQVDTFLDHVQQTRPGIDHYKLDEADLASVYRLDKINERLSRPDMASDPMSAYLRDQSSLMVDKIATGKGSRWRIREVATLAEGVIAALEDQYHAAEISEIRTSLEAHRQLAAIRGHVADSPTLCLPDSHWIAEALNLGPGRNIKSVKGCYSMAAQTAVVTTEAAAILRKVRYYEPLLHEEIHAVQDNELSDAEIDSLRNEGGHLEMAINEAVTQGLTLRKLARENVDTSESIAYVDQMIMIETMSGTEGEEATEAFLEELALIPRRHRVHWMTEKVFGADTAENKIKLIELERKMYDRLDAIGDAIEGDNLGSKVSWEQRFRTLWKHKEEYKQSLGELLAEELQSAASVS